MKLKDLGESIAGAATIATTVVLPCLRSKCTCWGATRAELQQRFPGDDFIPSPRWSYTHAITIRAPVAEVWAWLIQMGQGRGGLYSYEVLENLIGCCMQNADRILPEFQHLKVGDEIKLHPKAPGWPVAIVEPERAIVLRGDTRLGKTPVPPSKNADDFFATTWGFYLDNVGENTTRLIVRFKSDYNPTFRNSLINGPLLVKPIGCVMQRRMLNGIKQRAEASRNQPHR